MNQEDKVSLDELAEGALLEKFNAAFVRVMDNLKDVNTSFKSKRKIKIELGFVQNERRDNVILSISVTESLARQEDCTTQFFVEKDLRTGKVNYQEYGKQIRGQMSLDDFKDDLEEDDEEPAETNKIVDMRKVN